MKPTSSQNAKPEEDFFDILKGARHHTALPPKPKPPVAKSWFNSSTLKPTFSKSVSVPLARKPSTGPKVQPLSFEEMMKQAQSNVGKSENPRADRPNTSVQPKSTAKSSLNSSAVNRSSVSKPVIPTSNVNKSSISKRPMIPPGSQNVRHHTAPPPKLKPPVTKSLGNSSSLKPTSSKNVSMSCPTRKPPVVSKAQSLSFNDMMKQAQSNIGKSSNPKSDKSGTSSIPPKSTAKPLLTSSVVNKSSVSKPAMTSSTVNKSLLPKRPMIPPGSQNARYHVAPSSKPQSATNVIKKPQATTFSGRDMQNRSYPSSLNRGEPSRPYPMKRDALPDRFDRYPMPPKRRCPAPYHDDDEDSLDDFIVDDDEEVQGELNQAIKGFCRSDKRLWEVREREIDISKMNARYSDIDAEERRSRRLGKMEDMLEEKRGAVAL